MSVHRHRRGRPFEELTNPIVVADLRAQLGRERARLRRENGQPDEQPAVTPDHLGGVLYIVGGVALGLVILGLAWVFGDDLLTLIGGAR